MHSGGSFGYCQYYRSFTVCISLPITFDLGTPPPFRNQHNRLISWTANFRLVYMSQTAAVFQAVLCTVVIILRYFRPLQNILHYIFPFGICAITLSYEQSQRLPFQFITHNTCCNHLAQLKHFFQSLFVVTNYYVTDTYLVCKFQWGYWLFNHITAGLQLSDRRI